MSQTITQSRLRIDANFKRFVDEEVLPGTGLDAAAFWRNFDEIVHDLAPENRWHGRAIILMPGGPRLKQVPRQFCKPPAAAARLSKSMGRC